MPLAEASTPTTVVVDGRPLNVSVHGTGAPLLLINGLGGTTSTWDPIRPHLAGRTTIAYDAPGTGDSPSTRLPMAIPALARQAARLVRELGYRDVDILGFSLGGLVAQQLAWSCPRTVRRMVVMSTNMGWGSVPGDPRGMKSLFSLRRLNDPVYYAQLAPTLLGGRMRHDPELVRQVAEARTEENPDLRGYVWQMLSCASWSTLPFLPLIRQPTLVVAGDDDPLARSVNARVMAQLIPRGRLHVVEGGGHHLILERPEEMALLMRGFYEES
ncbi:hypothetical protein DSM112329_05419 [Paraconexibacter sp. AEG42_29]|uniref:AB hydrolase-1 domain-containing protein n=1 Tax=Paraconexibacter sp. AEG42_29 TaxID=2997339 RepID=A0AAU7B3D1_9ACTN